jgi:hypothetical protein
MHSSTLEDARVELKANIMSRPWKEEKVYPASNGITVTAAAPVKVKKTKAGGSLRTSSRPTLNR